MKVTPECAKPMVSVVVTTRNEERHIGNCLRAVQAQTYPQDRIEVVVVDNQSTDRTAAIAREFTEKVFDKGPERSAQRNYGILEQSRGDLILFLDADMILAPTTIEQGVQQMVARELVGVYIREIVLGTHWLGRVRRFERSFYDGTVIDCTRMFQKKAFAACGGFDTQMVGPEDWDLDKALKQLGTVGVLGSYPYREMDRFVCRHAPAVLSEACFRESMLAPVIFHNESELRVRRYIAKKVMYAPSFDLYMEKWGRNDPDIRKQLGFAYRFGGVFIENGKWKHLLSHPLRTIGMYGLRACVGWVYLTRRRRKARQSHS